MDKSDEYKILHQYYLDLKKLIEPNYLATAGVAFEADDPDERKFYMVVTEFFLQKKQKYDKGGIGLPVPPFVLQIDTVLINIVIQAIKRRIPQISAKPKVHQAFHW